MSDTPPSFALINDTLILQSGTSWGSWTSYHPGSGASKFTLARGSNTVRIDGSVTWTNVESTTGHIRCFNPASTYREYYW